MPAQRDPEMGAAEGPHCAADTAANPERDKSKSYNGRAPSGKSALRVGLSVT